MAGKPSERKSSGRIATFAIYTSAVADPVIELTIEHIDSKKGSEKNFELPTSVKELVAMRDKINRSLLAYQQSLEDRVAELTAQAQRKAK